MSQDVISGVGLTALAAAAARAVESSRTDRLIDDPLAAAFVIAARAPVPLPVRWPAEGADLSDQEILLLYGAAYVGVRSRFCDDRLRDACADGAGQVVVLAAGLRARGRDRHGLPRRGSADHRRRQRDVARQPRRDQPAARLAGR